MGIDEVHEGIRAAQDAAKAATTALEAARDELDAVRPALMEALTGARHPKAATAEVDLTQAVESLTETARHFRAGSARFDAYLRAV